MDWITIFFVCLAGCFALVGIGYLAEEIRINEFRKDYRRANRDKK